METSRTVMVANSATQKRYKITTNAKTLGELKKCLADNGISYQNMSFTEGITKTTLSDDNALLPTNIPFKGGVTNNLVLLLTNTRKNVASGATRAELYVSIKEGNFAEAIKNTFGKNFTQVSSADLASFLAEHLKQVAETVKESVNEATASSAQNTKEDYEKEEYVKVPLPLFNTLVSALNSLKALLPAQPAQEVEITDDDLEDILGDFEEA